MTNQYNPSEVYGVPITVPNSGTIQNTLTEKIPSLQDLANYNLVSREGVTPGYNMEQILNNPTFPTTNSGASDLSLLRPAPLIPESIDVNTDALQIPVQDNLKTTGIEYLNGIIRTQIGRRARIDFLLGSNSMVTKDGYILGVGNNYILINEIDTKEIITYC